MAAKSTSGRALEPVTGSAAFRFWDRPRTDVPGVGVRVNWAGETDTEGDGVGVWPGGVTLGLGLGVLGVGAGVLGVGLGDEGHGMGDTKPPADPVRPKSWPEASAVRLRTLGISTPNMPMSVRAPVAGLSFSRWPPMSPALTAAYRVVPANTMPETCDRPASAVMVTRSLPPKAPATTW